MQRTISSGMTFWYKFVFPPLWTLIFGLATAGFWLGAFRGNHNEPPPTEMKFGFTAVFIAGSVFIVWLSGPLKRVRIAAGLMNVSNYLREISVPFTAIRDVRQDRTTSRRPITIYFKEETAFGDRIKFMPKQRFNIRFWRVDPIVDELRRLAGLD